MKKTLAIILCIALVLSQSVYIFSGSNKEVVLGLEKDTINIVTLGSSQNIGYGLASYFPEQFKNWTGSLEDIAEWEEKGWEASVWDTNGLNDATLSKCGFMADGFGVIAEGAFPDLLRGYFEEKGYNVNLNQLGCTGFRANELVYFLYDDYLADDYALFQFYFGRKFEKMGNSEEEGERNLTNMYRTALKEADVITYDYGAANFGPTLIGDYGDTDINLLYQNLLGSGEYERFIYFREIIKNKVEALLLDKNINEDDIEGLSSLIDRITYSFLGYCTSLDKAMEWIYDNNEDANVIVMQIQNIYKDYRINMGGIDLPAGDIVNILISLANNYAASNSKYCDRYLYARVTDNERVRLLLDDLMDYESKDDLTQTLKVLIDVSPEGDVSETRLKEVFTRIYEGLGKEVKTTAYYEALDNAYDACIKLIQYVQNSDVSDNNEGYSDTITNAYGSLLSTISNETIKEYDNGKDNSKAIEKAIDQFNSFSQEEKASVVFYINFGLIGLPHPDEEGYQEMVAAVISSIESEDVSIVSRVKGTINLLKDLSYTMSKMTKQVLNTVKNNAVESIINEMQKINNDIKRPFSNLIEKAR